MPQISEDADRNLEALEKQLAKTIAEKDKAEQKYDLLWVQVFSEFDAAGEEGASASYIASDGYKLSRVVPEMQPVVNNDKLLALLNTEYGFDEGRKIWNRITVTTRVILQNKLAEELRKNTALAEKIDAAGDIIVVPTRKPSRIRKQATAKEKAMLNMQQAIAATDEAVG